MFKLEIGTTFELEVDCRIATPAVRRDVRDAGLTARSALPLVGAVFLRIGSFERFWNTHGLPR
jgi:hypothetical protein